jgi:predicted DNA-binding protein
MRLIIEVRDELHQRLKEQAQAEGRPQSAIVRELIEMYLARAKKAKKESKHGDT